MQEQILKDFKKIFSPFLIKVQVKYYQSLI